MTHVERTILIVDDSQESRQVYRRYLLQDTERHYRILEEESGEGGLVLCRVLKPDIILLDFLLPDLDGLEFLTQLLRDQGEFHPPVVVITAYGDESVAVQALKHGAQDYLAKDKITPEKLRFAVSSAIDNAQLKLSLQQSQDALRQSEQHLSLALEAAQMGTWEWNVVTGKFSCSESLERLYGMTPGSFGGTYKAWMQKVHPDDRESINQNLIRALKTTSDCSFEYRFIHPDSNIRWLSVKGRVFCNAKGEPLRLLGVAQDITDSKQKEEERARLLALEQAARQQAEAANRSKDEFLAIVSHELRSPLTSIIGWVKLLQTGKFDYSTTARALETIERSAKVQVQLIEDLLDVSRIIRGDLRLNVHSVNLCSVIHAAVDVVRPMAMAKNIQINSRLDAIVCEVLGDAERLEQIVWNLLSNAVKFTPAGGRVEVWLQNIDVDASPIAQITVSDTGKGIKPDFLPYVFDQFRRDNTTTTRKGDGLGLGLAIVKKLVELHQGTIGVESNGEGQGATFTVQLPLLGSSCKLKSSTAALARIFLKDIDILVVDDDLDTREIVSLLLAQNGAEVTTVASVAAAMQAIAAEPPDILITDLAMPQADGYALLSWMKQCESHQAKKIPAILLTACGTDDLAKTALAAGFAVYISKPFDPSSLVTAVLNLTNVNEQLTINNYQ